MKGKTFTDDTLKKLGDFRQSIALGDIPVLDTLLYRKTGHEGNVMPVDAGENGCPVHSKCPHVRLFHEHSSRLEKENADLRKRIDDLESFTVKDVHDKKKALDEIERALSTSVQLENAIDVHAPEHADWSGFHVQNFPVIVDHQPKVRVLVHGEYMSDHEVTSDENVLIRKSLIRPPAVARHPEKECFSYHASGMFSCKVCALDVECQKAAAIRKIRLPQKIAEEKNSKSEKEEFRKLIGFVHEFYRLVDKCHLTGITMKDVVADFKNNIEKSGFAPG